MGWFNYDLEDPNAAEVKGLSTQEQLQRKVFISTFAMLAKMAGADGTVKKREVEAVDRFMKNVLKLDGPRRKFAIQVFNKARNSPKSFREYAEEYKQLLRGKPEMYEWIVDVLARISLADEVFSQPEAVILHTACEVFGIDESRYSQLKSQLEIEKNEVEEDDRPYRALGCSLQSTDEEIDERYQALATQYSPEKVLSAGLPEEFVELARAKHAAIEEAYEEIRRRRGRA